MKRVYKILTILILVSFIISQNVFAFTITASWQEVDRTCNAGMCEGWMLRKKVIGK